MANNFVNIKAYGFFPPKILNKTGCLKKKLINCGHDRSIIILLNIKIYII